MGPSARGASSAPVPGAGVPQLPLRTATSHSKGEARQEGRSSLSPRHRGPHGGGVALTAVQLRGGDPPSGLLLKPATCGRRLGSRPAVPVAERALVSGSRGRGSFSGDPHRGTSPGSCRPQSQARGQPGAGSGGQCLVTPLSSSLLGALTTSHPPLPAVVSQFSVMLRPKKPPQKSEPG